MATRPCSACAKPLAVVAKSLPEPTCRSCRALRPKALRPARETKKRLRCATCGDPMWRGSSSLPQGQATCQPCRRLAPSGMGRRRCRWCGCAFIPRSSGTRTINRYCSRLCFGQAQGEAVRGRNLTYRQCEVCGKGYRYSRSDQRTCGRACGAVLRIRERPPRPIRVKVVPPPRDCLWCGRPCVNHMRRYCSIPCVQAMHPRASHVSPIGYGTCTECGALFVRRAGWVGAFCSTRCSHRARRRDDKHRRRATAASGDRITITALGERDAWRCHLCHRKVSKAMTARGNRPTSPSIDHLHPTSLGGLHVWSNVALAHRACNGKRSNTGAAQLLLDYAG